jgi:hypothetical protein
VFSKIPEPGRHDFELYELQNEAQVELRREDGKIIAARIEYNKKHQNEYLLRQMVYGLECK